MKYLSLFSGIGGFELGITQAYENIAMGKTASSETNSIGSSRSTNGATGKETAICIGFSEIDKYAVQIYQKHFPNHKNYGDITKINEAELPDFDLLVGGFPCQSFSIAGKRGGFADTRGTMFFEIARILKYKHPRLFLLENVKGLLSHDEGRTFATIISTLDELGYDLQWQVLNSKNFGVPQNRERVFIIGHLRGTRRPKVFPLTADGGETNELQGHIANTLTRRYEGAQAVGTYIGEGELNAQEAESSGQGVLEGGAESDNSHGGRREAYPSNIRRLTPTECERLQGFPDGWTEGVSDTQRYKCLGNAVTTNVVQAIVENLL